MPAVSAMLADVGRKSALTLGITVLLLFVRFGKNILISRILMPEYRGIWGLLNLLPDLLTYMGTLGLGASVTYHVGKKIYAPGAGLGMVLAGSLLFGIPLGIAAGWFLHQDIFWTGGGRELLLKYLPLVVIITPFFCLRMLGGALLLGCGQVLRLNACRMAESLFPLLLFIILYFFVGRASLDAATLGWFWGMLAAACVPILLLPGEAYPPAISARHLKTSLGFGLREHPGAVLNLFILRSGMIFTAALLPPAELGYYAIAVSIAELLSVVPESLCLPFTAALYRSEKGAASGFSGAVLRIQFWVLLPVCLVAMAGTWPFIYVFFGRDYLPAVPATLALIPGMLFMGVFSALKVDCSSKGRPGVSSLALAVAAAVALPCGWALIPRWGIPAAGGAASLAYFLAALGLLIFHIRQDKVSLRDVFLPRPEERRMLAALPARLFARRAVAGEPREPEESQAPCASREPDAFPKKDRP